jgi:hypothetical protein
MLHPRPFDYGRKIQTKAPPACATVWDTLGAAQSFSHGLDELIREQILNIPEG